MMFLVRLLLVCAFFTHCYASVPPASEMIQLCKKKHHHHKKHSTQEEVPAPPPSHPAPAEWARQRIQNDLAYYQDKRLSLSKMETLFHQQVHNLLLVKFTINNNQVVVEDILKTFVVKTRSEDFAKAIREVCRTYTLPNMVFYISMEDSLISSEYDGDSLPIFAMAKLHDDQRVILIPDFEALVHSTSLLAQVEKGNTRPWDKKIEKAIWRGSTTDRVYPITVDTFSQLARSQAIIQSLLYPDLIDARFTQLVQCSHHELVRQRYPYYFGSNLSIPEQLQYKYQLLIDGNSCSYSRAYWQLFSNSVILKQQSPHIQWYYDALQPYVHYIPLQEDMGDLFEQIMWATQHDEEVRQIMCNAQQFANNNLKQEHIYLYLYHLLKEYSKLQFVP